jgi:hypothetical protein
MRRFYRIGLMLILPISIAFGAPTQSMALTGGEVASDCANYPDATRKNLCEMWVSEIVEIVKSDDEIFNPIGPLCPPSDVSVSQHIASTNAWLAAHPELHKERAYKALYGAFKQKYPCR